MPPLYQRIKDYITRRIDSGEYAPGARVPSENQLLKELGASRMTVNRALRELTEAGVLYRVAGVGTFVAEAKLQHPTAAIQEIRQEIEKTGQSHFAQVIALETVAASGELAVAMELPEGSTAYHSRILHCADVLPVLLEDRWVNPAIAPRYLEVDFSETTPTQHLLKHAPLQRVEQRIAAVRLGAEGSRRMKLPEADPVLLLLRRTWTRNQVASVAHLYYAGSRYILDQGADRLPVMTPEFVAEETCHA